MTGPTAWALGHLPGAPADAPEPPGPPGSVTAQELNAWFVGLEPTWLGSPDDATAVAWLKDRLEHAIPCLAVRGPAARGDDAPGGVPDPADPSTFSVLSAPRRIPTGTPGQVRIEHRIMVGRPPEAGRTDSIRDDRAKPPAADRETVLVKSAEHLMAELPEIADVIRAILVESEVRAKA